MTDIHEGEEEDCVYKYGGVAVDKTEVKCNDAEPCAIKRVRNACEGASRSPVQ